MPYVLSKLANTQIYTTYAKGVDNINIPTEKVEIKGGADVTNNNLVTPEGVITKITPEQLDILKQNRDFQRHLDGGFVKYFGTAPNIEKHVEKMEKDPSRQITKADYEKKGKKAPKTESEE